MDDLGAVHSGLTSVQASQAAPERRSSIFRTRFTPLPLPAEEQLTGADGDSEFGV